MKATQEMINKSNKAILDLFYCECNTPLLIKKPVTKKNVLDHILFQCPECNSKWKIKITFEEI